MDARQCPRSLDVVRVLLHHGGPDEGIDTATLAMSACVQHDVTQLLFTERSARMTVYALTDAEGAERLASTAVESCGRGLSTAAELHRKLDALTGGNLLRLSKATWQTLRQSLPPAVFSEWLEQVRGAELLGRMFEAERQAADTELARRSLQRAAQEQVSAADAAVQVMEKQLESVLEISLAHCSERDAAMADAKSAAEERDAATLRGVRAVHKNMMQCALDLRKLEAAHDAATAKERCLRDAIEKERDAALAEAASESARARDMFQRAEVPQRARSCCFVVVAIQPRLRELHTLNNNHVC